MVLRHGWTCQEMYGQILGIGTKTKQLYTVKNWISWRLVSSLLKDCLKCLYLARMGRPDVLWSVNKLARSVKKWTRSHERRLAIYVYHTLFITQETTVNVAMCETRHSIVFWVYFKIQTLLETLKIINLSRGEFGVSSEVERLFL